MILLTYAVYHLGLVWPKICLVLTPFVRTKLGAPFSVNFKLHRTHKSKAELKHEIVKILKFIFVLFRAILNFGFISEVHLPSSVGQESVKSNYPIIQL